MKLLKIEISGYRGFENFSINSDNLSGLTIIAGQNGSGKSTIMEVVSYLLNGTDISQLNDPNVIRGFTKSEALWKIDIKLYEEEIDHFIGFVRDGDSIYFNSKELLKNKIIGDLKKVSDGYEFSLKYDINKPEYGNPSSSQKYKGSTEEWCEVPDWIDYLREKQLFFSIYVKPFENVGETMSAYFGIQNIDPDLSKINNTNIDLRNRNQRSNTNIGMLLKSIALGDVYNSFVKNSGVFKDLEEALGEINGVINPLEITYDKDDASKGHLLITLKNLKNDKTYPIQFASSGEKQVIGYVALLIYWKKQHFKPILLLDEPELHLHSIYIQRLARLIKEKIQNESKATCIIATHSEQFISENSDNIYQISPSSKKIDKITNIKDREGLLGSLGKKFDLAYLIEKIVFVEGKNIKKNALSDVEIYQKLIDQSRESIVFIPAAGKVETQMAADFMRLFFDKIALSRKSLKIKVIVDRDYDPITRRKNIFPTPYKTIENIFLLDRKAISDTVFEITNKKISLKEMNIIIRSVKTKLREKNLFKIDGKKAIHELIQELFKRDYKFSSNKLFLQKLLSNIYVDRLPTRVRKYFEKIKNA